MEGIKADHIGISVMEGADTPPSETAKFNGSGITLLPNELLRRIFTFCTPLDLCHLNLTCTRFKDNINKPAWVSSLTSVGRTHQQKYRAMTCYIPRLAGELKNNLIESVPLLLDLQTLTLESDILAGFWSTTTKLALSKKVCAAIEIADKSDWSAASLTHVLDILLKADQTRFHIKSTRLVVSRAIEHADKSGWDAASLTHVLDVLLKGGRHDLDVKPARIKVYRAIKTADMSGWSAASLTHMLDVLLKADKTSCSAKEARIKVCRTIENAE